MAQNDLSITNAPIKAGQTLGPYAFNANAADRYASVKVTVGTGDPEQGGGGVSLLVEATPPGTRWRQTAVLGFDVDAAIESVTLLEGFSRYRVSATATKDATISVLAARE